MKKSIILIICMAVCLSLIGGAIAVSYSKTETTGTIVADQYVALTIGGSATTSLYMEANHTEVYNIYAQIARSATAPVTNGHLDIDITTATGVNKSLENITFGLYLNEACTTPAYVGSTDLHVEDGELSFDINNIAESTNYYLKMEVGDVTSAQLEAMEGEIAIAFIKQAA